MKISISDVVMSAAVVSGTYKALKKSWKRAEVKDVRTYTAITVPSVLEKKALRFCYEMGNVIPSSQVKIRGPVEFGEVTVQVVVPDGYGNIMAHICELWFTEGSDPPQMLVAKFTGGEL